MIEIDGKYFLLEDTDLKSGNKVKRQNDTKNVWRCRCPRCSDGRQTEHRMQKCLAVYLGEVGECCVRMDEENHRFVGFNEVRTNGGVVQYEFQTADKSNWLISKAVQKTLDWEE